MFAGFDNVDTTNVDFVGPLSRVRPERVHDIEAGIEHQTDHVSFNANVFEMRFRNEITPIGALSYIGLPLRKNVARSVRRGLELDGTFRAPRNVVVTANATWMQGRISEYTDDATQETFRNVAPLLTPGFTSNHTVTLPVSRKGSVALSGRYVGRSFLSNTGDQRFVTPPGYLTDVAATVYLGSATVLVQLRNALNRRFYNAGYTDGLSSFYYIHPPRNLSVTTRWAFGRSGSQKE
jgi:iron complex outermembrane receptor protein